MDIKIDPATGLPELPEGYFWRVLNGHQTGSLGTYPGIEVRLMKQDTKIRWFKRVPCERVIERDWRYREKIEPSGVPDAIKEVAARVFKAASDMLPIHSELDSEIAAYAGDYPPMKLDTTEEH